MLDAGKTIGLRILTYRFDDENEPCPSSDSDKVYRSSLPFILPPAITSTFKGILFQETNSKFNATLHLSSGSSFVLLKQGGSIHNRDEFAFV